MMAAIFLFAECIDIKLDEGVQLYTILHRHIFNVNYLLCVTNLR